MENILYILLLANSGLKTRECAHRFAFMFFTKLPDPATSTLKTMKNLDFPPKKKWEIFC